MSEINYIVNQKQKTNPCNNRQIFATVKKEEAVYYVIKNYKDLYNQGENIITITKTEHLDYNGEKRLMITDIWNSEESGRYMLSPLGFIREPSMFHITKTTDGKQTLEYRDVKIMSVSKQKNLIDEDVNLYKSLNLVDIAINSLNIDLPKQRFIEEITRAAYEQNECYENTKTLQQQDPATKESKQELEKQLSLYHCRYNIYDIYMKKLCVNYLVQIKEFPIEVAKMIFEKAEEETELYDIFKIIKRMEKISQFIQTINDSYKTNPNEAVIRTTETKPVPVRIYVKAYYDSVIQIPKTLNKQEFIEYAKEHMREIPITQLHYVPGSDELNPDDYMKAQTNLDWNMTDITHYAIEYYKLIKNRNCAKYAQEIKKVIKNQLRENKDYWVKNNRNAQYMMTEANAKRFIQTNESIRKYFIEQAKCQRKKH